MSDHQDDQQLAGTFRDGLQRQAESVDTSAPVVHTARTAARRRQRRQLLTSAAVGLAAAAVVTAVFVQQSAPETLEGTVQLDDPPSDPLPTEWRTEAWHGLQVEVPADWAWGAAPIDVGGDTIRCGGPDDPLPYVGRPVASTDVCSMTKNESPTEPYVWLGADLDQGEVDLGGGWRQATFDMQGTTFTIGYDDERLAQRIVHSVVPVEDCAPSLDAPPAVESMLTEGLRNPTSAQVCAYRRESGESSWQLVYATTLGAKDAATYHGQVYDGGFESAPDFCDDRLDERVLVTVTGDDPYGDSEVTQDTVVDPGCREVQGSPGIVTPLSDKGMAAFTRNGLPVTLYGLIGPQG